MRGAVISIDIITIDGKFWNIPETYRQTNDKKKKRKLFCDGEITQM